MKTVYRLEQPGDCEGRTRTTVGFFSKKTDAQEVGSTGYKSQGMGGPEPHIREVTIYENLTEFCSAHPKYEGPASKAARMERVRKGALSKLSPEEREALGVR